MKIHRLALKKQVSDHRRIIAYMWLVLASVVIAILFRNKPETVGIILGAIAGLFGHWRATCYSSTTIPRSEMSKRKIIVWLESIGYTQSNDVKTLIPNLPSWLCFDSQDITLDSHCEKTVMVGPYYILKKLVREIMKNSRSIGTI